MLELNRIAGSIPIDLLSPCVAIDQKFQWPAIAWAPVETPMRQPIVALIFAVAALAGAGSANAQTATQDVVLTASVPKYCQISGGATGAVINETIPVSSAGVVTTTTISNTVASVVCNGTTDVLATSLSGGVVTATAAPSGFTNIIDYTAVATLDTAVSTIDTSSTGTAVGNEAGNTATTTAGYSGTLDIDITPQTPASPLVASTGYTDTLRVTLTPAP